MKTTRSLHTIVRAVLKTGMAVALLVLCTLSGKAQVSIGDSLALVDLYNNTNGTGWTSKTNWLTGPVATWQGVTLTNGRVTTLQLALNNLTGSLPYHIGFLQELKALRLNGNKLQGSLPLALVFLQKLENLNLSENQFTGSIPSTAGFMLKLTDLNLSKNKFSGSIPTSIALLQKLRKLDLSGNQLTGSIPAQIGLLASLEGLYLSGNKLQGTIPSFIGNLGKATDVYLNDNMLSGSLPSSLGDLDSLVFFNASNNNLTGAVPSSLNGLTRLYFFNISGNQIQDLPNLSGITSLFQLTVASNRLTFADIQPNLSRMLPGSYIPQDSVGTNLSVSVCAGDTLKLSADVIESDPNNRFIWFTTDGSFVSDELSTPFLAIPNAQAAQSGVYAAVISNSNVPDLFLYRKSIKVTVQACASKTVTTGETSVYPVPFDNTASVKVNTASVESLKITVRNASGYAVETFQATTSDAVVIGASLERGTYLVESVHGGKKEVVRVIKK